MFKNLARASVFIAGRDDCRVGGISPGPMHSKRRR